MQNNKEDMVKKELGQFFTPIEIVRYILDSAGFKEEILINLEPEKLVNLKIADLSVGEGIFLGECLSRLSQVFSFKIGIKDLIKKQGYEDPEKWIIEKNLYGVDIDKSLVEKTKDNLKKFYKGGEEIHFNIFHGNSLLSEIKEKIDFNFFEIKFDFLFGNPPYNKKINSKEKKEYFKLYEDSIGGHPNLCTLFIHKSINMLDSEGVLGYLVSAPFISAYYHRKLRKIISKETKILEILRFNDRKKVMEDILQELSILILKKEPPKSDYFLNVSTTKDKDSLINLNLNKHKINFSELLHNGEYNNDFLVAKNRLDYSIVNKMKNLGKPLREYAQVSTGEIVQFRSKELLSEYKEENRVPLIEIESVKPFSILDDVKKWYSPNKNNQYVHTGENIIVKRMTSKEQPKRLIASLVDKEKYSIDNKLNFIFTENKENLYCILGLLNSILLDYYFRLFSSNTQVSANELRFLPIILDKDIMNLSIGIHQGDKEKIKDLNEMVFQKYDLSDEEINHVLSYYE